MKRFLITLGVSASFLAITSVIGYAASFIPLGFWGIFGIGSAILVISGFSAIVLRRKNFVKILAMILNAVSMGFYLRSWYINRNFDNSLWLMLLTALLAALYLVVFMLPLLIPAVRRHCGIYLAVFILASIVGYVCLIIFTKTTWVSTLGYFGLLQLGFCFALLFGGEDSDLLRALQIASYSVLLCALIILIIVLGGDGIGDLFSGFDIPTGSRKSKGKNTFPPPNVGK